jgi:BirA family biotin operon repressor/biotin-[acetyl-CoA-carboxylase] ligase
MDYIQYKNFIIYEFNEVESTNDTAFQMALSGKIFDKGIVVATSQTKGRGRMKRQWESEVGNLYFSILLQPKIDLQKIPQLSIVAISALKIAVKKLFSHSKKIENKWPNDLLIDEKKIAGLLLESKISEKSCEFVVLGVGVNTNSNPFNTIFPSSNLMDSGVEISTKTMLIKFLDEFEVLYENWINFGFSKARNIWLDGAYRFKEKITIDKMEGIFHNLDIDGNLVLLDKNGSFKKISCGEIF